MTPLAFARHWGEYSCRSFLPNLTPSDRTVIFGVFSAMRGIRVAVLRILYGADDKPTPLGAFPILMKDADHVSATYGAPMPYTLRLTADGVSVHGTEVVWGYATHGCIGVPTAFAKLLFREAKLGDMVIVTRSKTLATGQALIN